jgi:hypothetical protein
VGSAPSHGRSARRDPDCSGKASRTQGILPVPAKIGNSDDADANLSWGCSAALKPVLRASADWRLTRTDKSPSPEVLVRAVFAHCSERWELGAQVYRGSAIKACITAFFAALASDEPRQQTPLVAYLGHDGLMDFPLRAEATARRARRLDRWGSARKKSASAPPLRPQKTKRSA